MDITLNYIDVGNGFPLILLHGNGESHEYFSNQTAFFKNKYRVIAIDTRGHGASPRGQTDFTLKQFSNDLHDFMTEHGIDKAHILGFSDGGNIAMYFALRYPHMVEKLILNGANLSPSGIKAFVQFPIVLGYTISGWFAKKSADAKANHEMLGLMVNEPHISASELQKLTAPTLVIAGTNDMVKKSHTELIAKSIPGSKLIFIKGDHFVAAKNPEPFNVAVNDFLKG